jgi:hypothetical protein
LNLQSQRTKRIKFPSIHNNKKLLVSTPIPSIAKKIFQITKTLNNHIRFAFVVSGKLGRIAHSPGAIVQAYSFDGCFQTDPSNRSATRLDGTLLRSDATLSEFAKHALNDLIEQGMLFTFCTSRGYPSAKNLLAGVNLRLPCILYNGVFMINPVRDDVLSANYLSHHLAEAILEAAESIDLSPFLCGMEKGTEKILFRPPQNEGQQQFVNHRPGDKRLRQVEQLSMMEQTISLNFIDTYDALLPLKTLRNTSTFRDFIRCSFSTRKQTKAR